MPARWNGDAATPPVFCRFSRDEGAAGAPGGCIIRLKRRSAPATAPFIPWATRPGGGPQVWVRVGEFVWVLCGRTPGQPYHPLLFTSLEEAAVAAQRIEPYLWPGAEAEQEYYFNTQNFT